MTVAREIVMMGRVRLRRELVESTLGGCRSTKIGPTTARKRPLEARCTRDMIVACRKVRRQARGQRGMFSFATWAQFGFKRTKGRFKPCVPADAIPRPEVSGARRCPGKTAWPHSRDCMPKSARGVATSESFNSHQIETCFRVSPHVFGTNKGLPDL